MAMVGGDTWGKLQKIPKLVILRALVFGNFHNFYIKLSEVVDLHVPLKKLSKQHFKARSKPWITSGIRTSIKIKNGSFKKFLKTKCT